MMRVGMYNRWLQTLGGGERYSLAIAEYLSQSCQVEVISHAPVDMYFAAQRLGLSLDNVAVKVIPPASVSVLTHLSAQFDLFINASNWDFFHSLAPKSALLIFFPYHPGNPTWAQIRYQVGRRLNRPALSAIVRALLGKRLSGMQTKLDNLIDPNFLKAVDSYSQLWVISQFSQQWTQRYWRRPTHLLYPPVAIEQIQPQPKQQIILNVGRFFAGNHNKKHLVMIDAFKQLVSQGFEGWELHLAGGSTPGVLHEEYLHQVREASRGLPVHLHVDLDRPALLELYGKSAIYWHASGFGEDEDKAPHKLEHFGITTVEAMAAGCVPVVIAKGGQLELVEHEVNGLLWQSMPQLISLSASLITDKTHSERLATAAIARSRQFSHAVFNSRLQELFVQMGVDRA